jgi:hypothetical protein
MAWYEQLMQQGYTPPGATPHTITPEGGLEMTPTNSMSRFAKGLSTFMNAKQAQDKKQQEMFNLQMDAYKTLRDSGYDSQKAYMALQRLELDKDRLSYLREGRDKKTPTVADTIGKIYDKMARGEKLSDIEQAMYKDYNTRYRGSGDEFAALVKEETAGGGGTAPAAPQAPGLGGLGDFGIPGIQNPTQRTVSHAANVIKNPMNIFNPLSGMFSPQANTMGQPATTAPGKMVPVISPDGQVGSIPEEDLEEALAQGYKRR